jgi:hypothetical protein
MRLQPLVLLLCGAAAAVSASIAPFGAASAQSPVGALTVLDQGWSKEVRELYYFTPQGSRLIRYAWFLALEHPDTSGMFAAAANLQRYGFIASDGPHPLNPDGLPIGFAIDPGPAERADLGLTCAACHTSNVTVGGRSIRLDGAPAHLDFDAFYSDLDRAVSQTLFDPEKFARFAARVMAGSPAPDLAALKQDFAAYQVRLAGEAAIRRPTLRSGYGRVDALTQIINSLAAWDQSDPGNLRSVNAPTSYPPLWLTPQLEFVQWNPIAASPIGRNGGEVLGVFGKATLTGAPGDWFASSVLVRQLIALEGWITDLKPPRWDEVAFGPIDAAKAGAGEALFGQYCTGCHNAVPYNLTDAKENFRGERFIKITPVDYKALGVDPLYVESVAQRLVRTNQATASIANGAVVRPAAPYFLATVGAIVTRAMREAGMSDAEQIAAHGFRFRPVEGQPGRPGQPYQPRSLTALKAGPLAAVWATGPYLHNGSVPTVYELLSPVEERRKVFWTGARELDRERLGFVSEDAPGRFRFDTSLLGNRNTGHLFPAQGLTHDERMAILEFLKTQ